jgi:hypothetical protein
MSEVTGKLATYCTANTEREIYFKVRNQELWQIYLKHRKSYESEATIPHKEILQ